MTTVLLRAPDYRMIREVPFDADLPTLCREAEEAANDGYVVVAECNGRLVADAEGYWDRSWDQPDPFDLACERRYD